VLLGLALAGWDLDPETSAISWFGDVDSVLGSAAPPTREALLALVPDAERAAAAAAMSGATGAPSAFAIQLSAEDERARRWVQIQVGRRAADQPTAPLRGVAQDVTQVVLARAPCRHAALAFEASHDAMVVTDASGAVVRVNPAFEAILGYDERDVVGRTPRLWRSNHHEPSFYSDMWRKLTRDGFWQGEIWNRRRSGEVFPAWLQITATRGSDGAPAHYVGAMADMTHGRRAASSVARINNYDALTGLPNRFLGRSFVEQAVARAARGRTLVGLLLIDLDRFAAINDGLGHRLGDQVLVTASLRVRAHARSAETVARVGGDELLLIVEDIDQPEAMTHVAGRMMELIRRPFDIAGEQVFLTASMGIAVFPRDARDAETLLERADTGLHRAKREGRDRFCFYSDELTRAAAKRWRLETELRGAIESGRVVVHYQPQVRLSDGAIVGVEALARLHHPSEGLLGADRFIPLAEETGLIIELGAHVLREACRALRRWLDAGASVHHVAVNLAAQQLASPRLVDVVAAALDGAGLPPERLVLEITETAAIATTDTLVLERLRDLGVVLAVDDFGTGHSSLAYLKRLPVQQVKVDRCFVAGLPEVPSDRAIVEAVIVLASALGLTVVAEGVETPAQRDALASLGCDHAQGWLFARALDEDALSEFLISVGRARV